MDIKDLKFDEKGLIPAIVVDSRSKRVLTLAYMNRESLALTLKEERTVFWSRSRQELWRKGETSGNVQHLVSVTADCDRDALVVEVEPDGPACHLGGVRCFEFPVWQRATRQSFSAAGLMAPRAGRTRGAHHLLGACLPVAEGRVDVEIAGHVIFSCLTLWSMTWREASSARTSSSVMPASVISTMTW